jgi:hypothetical protein
MGRVLIKARIVRLKRGSKGADAHLRYLQLDGRPGKGSGGAVWARDRRGRREGVCGARAGGPPSVPFQCGARGRRPAFQSARLHPRCHAPDGGRPPNQTRLGRGRSFQHWPSTQPCSDPSQGRHGQGSHHRPGLYVIDGLRLRARSR